MHAITHTHLVSTGGFLQAADTTVKRMPSDATLVAVERAVANAMRRTCKEFNDRQPDVVVVAHEMDPRSVSADSASSSSPTVLAWCGSTVKMCVSE